MMNLHSFRFRGDREKEEEVLVDLKIRDRGLSYIVTFGSATTTEDESGDVAIYFSHNCLEYGDSVGWRCFSFDFSSANDLQTHSFDRLDCFTNI